MDHVRCTWYVWKDGILKTFSLLVNIRKLSVRHGGNFRWSRWGERRVEWKGKKIYRKDVEADFCLPKSNIPKEKDLLHLCPTVCNILKFCISLKLKHFKTSNLIKKCCILHLLRFLTQVVMVSQRELILVCSVYRGKYQNHKPKSLIYTTHQKIIDFFLFLLIFSN